VAKVAPSIVVAEAAASTVEAAAEAAASTVEAALEVVRMAAEAAEAAIAESQSQARRRRPLLRAAFASALHCIALLFMLKP
jgi:hypothetical protein